MKIIQFLVLVLIFLNLGCGSNWETNPLAGYDKSVRDGKIPGQEKAEKEKGLREKIFFDVANITDFKEGVEKEMTVNYRVGLENFVLIDFFIEEIEARMPESEWDATEKLIRWTPPTNFVVGDDYFVSVKMMAVLVIKTGDIVLQTNKEFFVNVYRDQQKPLIRSVSGITDTMTEERSAQVTITVDDLDSMGSDPSKDKAPELIFFANNNSRKSAGPLFQLRRAPRQDRSLRHRWIYDFTLDLSKLDIRRDERYGAGIIANSRFGEASEVTNIDFTLQAELKNPESTWANALRVPLNQRSSYEFGVFDPDESARIDSVEFTAGCSGEFTCTCGRQNTAYSQCKIEGTPTSTRYLDVRYRVTVSRSGVRKSRSFSNRISPVNSN